jgi:hypothetical protein
LARAVRRADEKRLPSLYYNRAVRTNLSIGAMLKFNCRGACDLLGRGKCYTFLIPPRMKMSNIQIPFTQAGR